MQSPGRHTRRTALLCVGLLFPGVLALAQERRLRGTIVNRDRTPQRGCRVEFFSSRGAAQHSFEAYADDYGNYYLYNPPSSGSYEVKASLGGRSQWISGGARISGNSIEPSVLTVDW